MLLEGGANPVRIEIGSSLCASRGASVEKNGGCIGGRVTAKSSALKAGSMLVWVNGADSFAISDADDSGFGSGAGSGETGSSIAGMHALIAAAIR